MNLPDSSVLRVQFKKSPHIIGLIQPIVAVGLSFPVILIVACCAERVQHNKMLRMIITIKCFVYFGSYNKISSALSGEITEKTASG